MFRYSIDFPLNNVSASKILRNLGVKKFKYVGSSKKYISLEHGYEISFDHDMGFVQFNNELQNKIGAIMDQITDIVGAERGEYSIFDDDTGKEVSFVTGEEIECEADLDEEQDEDVVSNCSSYEFGRVTADEAEEWLAEMNAEQNNYVKYDLESDDEARIDDDCASLDEWLPPAEQRQKHKESIQKKAENKSLKQQQKVARWFERVQKKANRTEQEKVAYAAKVDAIIADRRAKKAVRLQAEQERLQAHQEKIQAVLERFEAEAEKEKQNRIQKKLQRLHRQLN